VARPSLHYPGPCIPTAQEVRAMPATPKQPEDHKTKAEPFIWTTPKGRKVKFHPYNRLPFALFAKARNAPELESIFLFLEEALSDKDLAVITDDCEIEDINEAIASWQKAAGVTPGE
jgi:hypothetical protein